MTIHNSLQSHHHYSTLECIISVEVESNTRNKVTDHWNYPASLVESKIEILHPCSVNFDTLWQLLVSWMSHLPPNGLSSPTCLFNPPSTIFSPTQQNVARKCKSGPRPPRTNTTFARWLILCPSREQIQGTLRIQIQIRKEIRFVPVAFAPLLPTPLQCSER